MESSSLKTRGEPLVILENIQKYYGDRLAVDNINFEVGRGEILGFLGPNGAGKTTTMRIIAGYMPPTNGQVLVAGINVLEKPVEAKKYIGYLPENPPLYTDMTVVSYLKFVAKLKKLPRKKIGERIEFVLEKCGLRDVKGRLIGNLSRGYKQRVGIAQAIIHDPDIIILDEPTVGLDPKQVIEIRNLIKEISKDKTVILSTHILSEVTRIANRVIIIANGKLVFAKYLDEIGNETERKFIVKFGNATDCQKAKDIVRSIPGTSIESENTKIRITSQTDVKKEILVKLIQNNITPEEIYEEKPSLEDIYIKVVAGSEGVEQTEQEKRNQG